MRDMAVDVLLARTCALHGEALGIVAGPAVYLGVGNLRMKLHPHGGRAIQKGLVGKGPRRGGEQACTARQLEAFLMPLVNMIGKLPESLAVLGA